MEGRQDELLVFIYVVILSSELCNLVNVKEVLVKLLMNHTQEKMKLTQRMVLMIGEGESDRKNITEEKYNITRF